MRYWLRSSDTPPEPGFHRLSRGNRSPGHFLPGAVSVSPNFFPAASPVGLGREGGISPPSAQRSRTSPIRGMRLQRLLGSGWRPEPVGVAPRRALSGIVCVAVWRSAQCTLFEKAHGAGHRDASIAQAFQRGHRCALLRIARKIRARLRLVDFFLEHQYIKLPETKSHNNHAGCGAMRSLASRRKISCCRVSIEVDLTHRISTRSLVISGGADGNAHAIRTSRLGRLSCLAARSGLAHVGSGASCWIAPRPNTFSWVTALGWSASLTPDRPSGSCVR